MEHKLFLLLCALCHWNQEVLGGPFPSFGGGDSFGRKINHGKTKRATDERENCGENDVPPATRVDTTQRLLNLRNKFNAADINAFIVPMDDSHQSEYVAVFDKRVEYISGFSGSAGTAIITATKAALWTDGRYFLQGEDELDCNWIFMKEGESGVPTKEEWLALELSSGEKVGVDASVYSYDQWMDLKDALDGIEIKESNNLVDEIWDNDDENQRPEQEDTDILVLNMTFSGETWKSKVDRVFEQFPEDVDAVVVTALDENAWLFNLRGTDIPYNPVFFSYGIANKATSRQTLYIPFKNDRLSRQSELVEHLNTGDDGACSNENCVEVKDYDDFFNDLASLSADLDDGKKVWVSPMSSYLVYSKFTEEKAYLKKSIIRDLKGSKNTIEVEGMKKCHKRDSAVVIDFVAMLEKDVQAGKKWTELSASDELDALRGEQMYNKGLSFATISASGANGAIIHYKPQPETDADITTSDMYLLDSGGQYLDGTTDVTRTFHFGTPTDFEKEAYTRVLMGVIDLALAKWPSGVYGRDLDILARNPLWQVGLNYRHGTGHGIGAFLNVHEGPGRINMGYRPSQYESYLFQNMFFSDEPGYYEDGKFGIRLETIVMTKKITTEYEFGGGDWLGFEEFTLVPFEPHLIDYKLLSDNQLDWLNDYHKRCQQEIGEEILKPAGKTAAFDWLSARTAVVTNAANLPQLSGMMAILITMLIALI